MSGTTGAYRGIDALAVWLADLDTLEPALERVEADAGLLAPSERAWASAGGLEVVRRYRRLARIALRVLLRQAGVPAARGVELSADAHGKPSLGHDAPAFNLSHTRGMALIALAPRGPVGVDLEAERDVQLGPERRALIIAAGLGIGAKARLEAGSAVLDERARFLTAWTRLEAFAKARGTGIGVLLTDLGITAAGARSMPAADVAAKAEQLARTAGFAVVALDLPAGRYGAVAAPREWLADKPRVQNLAA